jgi:FkbM family methyltransferase
MINYIRRKIAKARLKNSFKEYGYTISEFNLPEFGKVEYAQWQHPFETKKEVTGDAVKFYRALTKKGGLIIDIGAHTGDTAVPMGLAVGKEGLVLALEPNRYVFKILEKNASLNPAHTRIVPLNFAATAEDGEFVFNYSDASFCNGGFLSEIENQKHHHKYELKVQGRNLEKLLLASYAGELGKLQLLKVDAEGYDKEILKGVPNIIKQYKPALLVECYKKLTPEERHELYDVIDGFGYDLFYQDDFIATGAKVKINRGDMTQRSHFDILGLPR